MNEFNKKSEKSYVIGSGWWCAGDDLDGRQEFFGDEMIRGKGFHKVWYSAIDKFASPKKIFIVDSNSPVKPPLNSNDSRIEFVSLDHNPGHSTNHPGKFCGFTRSIMLGIEYALQCEVDYFVFVEQDALIYGENVIEYCINSMVDPYMFGSGSGVPQVLQQSFFIIDLKYATSFMSRLRNIPYADGILSPEQKFAVSASFGPLKILSDLEKFSGKLNNAEKFNRKVRKISSRYQWLPIGYGRRRPVNFGDDFFYFQHGTKNEIEEFLRVSGINLYDF